MLLQELAYHDKPFCLIEFYPISIIICFLMFKGAVMRCKGRIFELQDQE
jgi:hypothetical protein